MIQYYHILRPNSVKLKLLKNENSWKFYNNLNKKLTFICSIKFIFNVILFSVNRKNRPGVQKKIPLFFHEISPSVLFLMCENKSQA